MSFDHKPTIAAALKTGGYAMVAKSGDVSINYVNEWNGPSHLDTWGDNIVQQCIDAGLPVIDNRPARFDELREVVVRGPMIGLGTPIDKIKAEPPYGAFHYAPLTVVAAMYQDAGSIIHNLFLTSRDAPAWEDWPRQLSDNTWI